MRILSTEYESAIDEKAKEFMSTITEERVMEAVACAVDCDAQWKDIILGLQYPGPDIFKSLDSVACTYFGLRSLVYTYWRGVIAGQNPFNEWVETQKEDEAADRAEDVHELYEMNQRGD